MGWKTVIIHLLNLTKVRVGNLTFDGVDSKMLHLGEFGGPMLGDAIRFTNFKNGTWIKAQ